MTEPEHTQLSSIARSRSMAAALTVRARIVLAAATGQCNSAIVQRFELTPGTVGKWRRRFLKHRIAAADFPRIRNADLSRFTVDRSIAVINLLGARVDVAVKVRVPRAA